MAIKGGGEFIGVIVLLVADSAIVETVVFVASVAIVGEVVEGAAPLEGEGPIAVPIVGGDAAAVLVGALAKGGLALIGEGIVP